MAGSLRTPSFLPLGPAAGVPDDRGVLSAHCPRHGRTVLLTTAQIRGVTSGERAHVVRWTCTCGATGSTTFPRRSTLT